MIANHSSRLHLALRGPRVGSISKLGAYILKAEKVAVRAILAVKNWRKNCVNLNKTKIATKVRKS